MICTVPEGKVCTTILQLYNEDAIVVELRGALSIAALDDYAEVIKGKTVVCIVSGSNNDIDRMQEIKERSLQYEGLKHYFLIRFAQRPLAERVCEPCRPGMILPVLNMQNIIKKQALPVGIELKSKQDYEVLVQNMDRFHINYTELKQNDNLFGYPV